MPVEGSAVSAETAGGGADTIDESRLRHPLERPVFVASVILNFVLMGLAITFLFYEPSWIKVHPLIDKEVGLFRALAITALIGIPLLVLNRNRREAAIRGNSYGFPPSSFPRFMRFSRITAGAWE
jgi:hypothetical protein